MENCTQNKFRQFDLENKGKEHGRFGYSAIALSMLWTCKCKPKITLLSTAFMEQLLKYLHLWSLNLKMIIDDSIKIQLTNVLVDMQMLAKNPF